MVHGGVGVQNLGKVFISYAAFARSALNCAIACQHRSGMASFPAQAKAKCRTTPFQMAHEIEFGVRVCARSTNGEVDSVECRSCVFFGREVGAVSATTRKRKATERTKYWRGPFRKELFRAHMEQQHPTHWEKYRKSSRADKECYFEQHGGGKIASYFEVEGEGLVVQVGEDVVENVIGGLFFRSEEEEDEDGEVSSVEISKEVALRVFKKEEESGPRGGAKYVVRIRNQKRFELVIKSVADGLSFEQVAKSIQNARDATSCAELGGLSGHIVASYTRVLVGLNLQIIGDLLNQRKQWAFAFAGDGSTCHGVSFFDIRLRIMVGPNLKNIHLLLVPFYERHTAQNIHALVCTILDSLRPTWRDSLLAVSTDGENTMTGRHGGLATLLEKEASNNVLRFWCGGHQVDLKVKKATQDADDGKFDSVTHTLSVHLRKQSNLVVSMGSKCPKDTTRWLARESLLTWLLKHRRTLLEHLESRPDQAPTQFWWLLVAGIQPFLVIVTFSMKSLQKQEITIPQQAEELRSLAKKLAETISVRDIAEDDSFEELDVDSFYLRTSGEFGCWVELTDVESHLKDTGSWVPVELAKLSPGEKRRVLRIVSAYCIDLVVGAREVRAERDSNNAPAEKDHPPIYPREYACMRTGKFISDVLEPFRVHIRHHWSDTEIDAIETDHKSLVTAFKTEPRLVEKFEKHTKKTMFNDAWDDCGGRFSELRLFSGGLAVAFPNTACVESDFSLLKFDFSSNRISMSNLSLGGSMHARQYEYLKKLQARF